MLSTIITRDEHGYKRTRSSDSHLELLGHNSENCNGYISELTHLHPPGFNFKR
jgi:hypothetical protein